MAEKFTLTFPIDFGDEIAGGGLIIMGQGKVYIIGDGKITIY